MGLCSLREIGVQFRFDVVVNQVSNCDSLLGLTIPGFIYGYPEAVAGLPSIFRGGVFLHCADDSHAADTPTSWISVPPKKFPTIRSGLSTAKPKISPLIARSHSIGLL
jgi:hypothetical protein